MSSSLKSGNWYFEISFSYIASVTILTIALSIYSTTKGSGTLNVSYIPASLILAVIILSLAVGVITGYYPAKRATKISALDALRYE